MADRKTETETELDFAIRNDKLTRGLANKYGKYAVSTSVAAGTFIAAMCAWMLYSNS